MKNICKKIYLIILTIASLALFSCDKIPFNIIENVKETAESKEVTDETSVSDETIEIGDKLVELKGYVKTRSKYQLPEAGSELYGFKVKAIYEYESRNAKAVLFEHEKTGAKAFLLSNDDEDKLASFGFNTLTFDNKGIPHVFEHSCLGGSEKYPNANLFTEAINRTYNTYINAFTMQHATTYPLSSLSDVQLFELYKFYMDGVLNPNVLRDEKNLEREAYRYVLNDKNSDIELKGVVYSEMSGNEGDISNVAYRNSLKTMYNNSYLGMNTGGETAHIPEITNDELINFHNQYYHPSNMIITLYGDIDYSKYLKYADEEYLSKYDKKVIDKTDKNYKRREGFSIEKYDFPVSMDAEIEGQTVINYNVICEGMTAYESGLFELIMSALENSDGPIKRRLLEKLPDASFYVINNLYLPKPSFSLTFNNVNEEDAEIVKQIVEESFEEMIEKGISKDILENLLNYIEWENEMSKDSHGFANQSLLFYARAFSSNGEDILGYFKHDKALTELSEASKKGLVKELIDKYLQDKNNFSMDMTVPKKGLFEENSANLKENLRKMKDGLTDSEITELINKNKEFDKWAEDQVKNSIIDKLRVATISELDEYRAKCYAYEENAEGVNIIRSEIEDSKYNEYSILFDISNLSVDEAMKLKFLSSLFLELPTANYTGPKLKAELDKYTISNDACIFVNKYFNGGYKPYFEFSCRSLDRNLDKAYELMSEYMFETRFDDVEIVKNVVSTNLNNLMSEVSYDPTRVAEAMLSAKTNKDGIYDYKISGVNYINFLKEVSKMSDDEIRELLKECETIYKNIFNSNGIVCEIIGNFDTIKNIKTKVINLARTLKHEKIVSKIDIATNSTLPRKTAVVANGTMNYNYIATPLFGDGIKYTSKYAVLGRIIDDKILYPEFRVKRSAYGSYSSFTRLDACVYTYRDPNVKESYDVFKNIPKLVSDIKLSNDELDDYKLNAYSSFAYPLTKIEAARIAVSEAFSKVDEKRPDRFVRFMREIKEMTFDDIKDLSKVLDKMIKDEIYVTVGSKEKIEANTEMFDEIIYDYVR